MNKGSDLYFYLGLVLVIVQFVVMASAIAMIVSDVREFYKEKKESKSNPSNSNKNDE
jgi:large-conductance mechanosensitive channel